MTTVYDSVRDTRMVFGEIQWDGAELKPKSSSFDRFRESGRIKMKQKDTDGENRSSRSHLQFHLWRRIVISRRTFLAANSNVIDGQVCLSMVRLNIVLPSTSTWRVPPGLMTCWQTLLVVAVSMPINASFNNKENNYYVLAAMLVRVAVFGSISEELHLMTMFLPYIARIHRKEKTKFINIEPTFTQKPDNPWSSFTKDRETKKEKYEANQVYPKLTIRSECIGDENYGFKDLNWLRAYN